MGGEKPGLENVLGRNQGFIRAIQKHLIHNAIALLGLQWSTNAFAESTSTLVRNKVETHNIGRVGADYQKIFNSSVKGDLGFCNVCGMDTTKQPSCIKRLIWMS